MNKNLDSNVCEENTYKGLFEKYSLQIRNFLIYRGCELDKAHDLVQEAYVKMWENCAKILPEKAKSFLYTVASNAFKNDRAHLKVKLKYQESGASSKVNIETPEFKMEEQEFKKRLEDAIEEMVPTQREVFLMNRIDKKKYSEIAEELGVSVKAVEKRMGKALKFLRARIKEI